MGFFNILILIFFSTQFNNNKKKVSNLWVQPDPCGLGWVGLMWWIGLGWIFFDPPWRVGSKNLLNPTQPDPCTPLVNLILLFSICGQFSHYINLQIKNANVTINLYNEHTWSLRDNKIILKKFNSYFLKNHLNIIKKST